MQIAGMIFQTHSSTVSG
ncbi:DUF6783 domain-containing protein [Blautia wexlerae]